MRRAICGLIGLALLGAACGGAKPSVSEAPAGEDASRPAPAVHACARRHPGSGPVRVGQARQSSSVALVKAGGATLAYIADEDDHLLHTIDVDSRASRAVTPLDGAPAQILVLADGRVAVTLRDKNRVQIFEPAAEVTMPLEARCAVPVAAEPFGIAATPDDRQVLVTSAWGKRLSAFDAASMKPAFDVAVNREPRAVLVDDDGQRAFVAHVVGATMSVIDLTTDKHEVREIDLRAKKFEGSSISKLRGGCQGFALAKVIEVKDDKPTPQAPTTRAGVQAGGSGAGPEKPLINGKAPVTKTPPAPRGRVFAPMVTVDPGEVSIRSSGYGNGRDNVAAETPIVSVVDADAERALTKVLLTDGARHTSECILPRAAAVSPATGSLFVTCLGIDALLELDARGLDPMRLPIRRWRVPSGPTGVAIDGDGARAVVWSQFERQLAVIDLGHDEKTEAVATIPAVQGKKSGISAAAAWGRQLFHKTDDAQIASDGRACASCHPDGREDALTWSTPEGPRQTIMLAGRTGSTAPFSWSGAHVDLKSHIRETFSRLGGGGLPDEPERFDEMDALIAYLSEMRAPALEGAAPRSEEAALAARGKALFFEESQGCATCHVGGPGTDGEKHDVGGMGFSDGRAGLDTPSLRFVSGTAPYFHDGRYSTLEELLTGSDGKMGHTLQLSRQDVVALKAYMETL